MVSYTPLAASLLLFIAVGVGFIFVHLVAGKFLRPNKPDAEKKTIYECGEPTIGSAWIQFDLRFYVVALLFVIFDVEVAFFFPWAVVFGNTNAIAAAQLPANDNEWNEFGQKVSVLSTPSRDNQQPQTSLTDTPEFQNKTPEARQQYFEDNRNKASNFAWFVLMDILVFFGVLLVGFAYLWKRGDLAWVRSTLAEEEPLPAVVEPPVEKPAKPAELVGSGAGSH
jgi:NADH-quinone oxidoreductase subunit A